MDMDLIAFIDLMNLADFIDLMDFIDFMDLMELKMFEFCTRVPVLHFPSVCLAFCVQIATLESFSLSKKLELVIEKLNL